jgi:uncharacterized membrane protein YphA (DoxX/SURF4 family)
MKHTLQKVDNWLAMQHDKAPLFLRLGLAIVFVYAALSSLVSPRDWVGYVPNFIQLILPAEVVLVGLSVVELVLAVWLLSGVYVRYAAVVAAALLAGVTISNLSLLPISFRDIGLFFAALALAVMKPRDPSA